MRFPALALAALCAAVTPRAASARDPAPAPQNRNVVAIEVAGSPEVVARVRSVSSEVLGRLGVTPIVTAESAQPTAAPEPQARPLAYAYIDLEDPLLPRLVFVDGATSRELTRRTLPRTTSLETSTEAVTLVLYMLVESLLAAPAPAEPAPAQPASAEPPPAQPASAQPPPAQPAPAQPAPPETRRAPKNTRASQTRTPRREEAQRATPEVEPETPSEPAAEAPDDSAATYASGVTSPSWVSVELGAFGRLLALGNSTPVAGAGGTLGLRATRTDPRFGVLLLGAGHFPTTPGYRGASSRITTVSGRLFITLDYPLTQLLRASCALGGGADWFRAELDQGPPEVNGRSTTSVDPIVSALLGARAEFARHFALNLALGLDLDAAPRNFVVQAGPERRVVLELARFRPSLLLGLAWMSGARTP